MTTRPTDITSLQALIGAAENKVSTAQDAIDAAAAELARLVGPLAAAHRMAMLAVDLAKLAEEEGTLP